MILNILKVLQLKLVYSATTRLIRQLLVYVHIPIQYLYNNTSTGPAAILAGNLICGDTT